MEESIGRPTTPLNTNSLCDTDVHAAVMASLDERLLDITGRQSLNAMSRTPQTKKAKRIRFFRNGDKFYTGVVMAVTPERYRSFDSLACDLTRALVTSVTLPNGVRNIYSMDGKKVSTITDLEDGKSYVVSGQGELFKKVEYSSSKVRRGSSLSGLPQSPASSSRQVSVIPTCVKARIVTLIRNGTKPRKIVRLLLNKRNAPSLEHVFEAITDAVKLDSGAVRKVYSLSGTHITQLEQFFENEEIFIAYGTEKSSQEDLELDFEESKGVQSFRRGPWISTKRQMGSMPKMPHKSGNKLLPQVRTPSPSTPMLPQPLRMHYCIGNVIGDGNFAVVRHCTHKASAAEYAIKIIDKYKCKGKEMMLASEVAILKQVCHPNIISLIAEQETNDQLFLVMELVKGGDLFDAIAAATKFSEPEASVMIGHLTSALAYLHSHHIVHRDVKPENLLVELDGTRVRCLKLGDFGLAQVVREPLFTVCGTPTYVAPEILAEIGYGLKIDVWAAGVILYILLCGFPPFVSRENEQEELFERILSGQYEFTPPYWDMISDSAKQLISNMLQTQPELRFSAEDVLDHPWLTSFLGDEQTSAATAAAELPQQHGDQQCQPVRVATFEFDYKKQRFKKSHREHLEHSDSEPFKLNVNINPPSPSKSIVQTDLFQELHLNDDVNGRDSQSWIADNPSGRRNSAKHMDKNNKNNDNFHLRSAHTPMNMSEKVDLPEKNCVDHVDSKLHSTSPAGNGFTYSRLPIYENSNIGKTNHFGSNAKKGISSNKKLTIPKVANGKYKSNSCDSVDRLSDSSGNDIKTSDSFVNIQYARYTHNAKSSSSISSHGSFDNVRFAEETHFTKPDATKRVTSQESNKKSTKPSRISVLCSQPQNKDPVGESVVKFREKKNKQPVNDFRNKRFSCYGRYTSKRPNEGDVVTNTRQSVGGNRFSSTDELRQNTSKVARDETKRFSLYYTPQLARKTYETENKSIPKVKVTTNNSREISKREGPSTISEKRDVKNRKSLIEGLFPGVGTKRPNKSIKVTPSAGTK